MSGSRRRPSSQRWLTEHFADPYVREAHRRGLRSRAGFKLEEIQRRDRVLAPGMVVVDLGAAPGGWSAFAAAQVGRGGRVYALDRLDMAPLSGVEFLRGDFREEAVMERLCAALPQRGADVLLSDMAPNLSGTPAIDQPRAMLLSELALELGGRVLRRGGAMVVKVFTGSGSQEFLARLKQEFAHVRVRKPQASRGSSREVYMVATGFRPAAGGQPPAAEIVTVAGMTPVPAAAAAGGVVTDMSAAGSR